MGTIQTPDYKKCVRCRQPIFNVWQKRPWCDGCQDELQAIEMNGEEILEMVLQMIPPTPPHPEMPIKVIKVQEVCRKVLINYDLLPGDDDSDDGTGAAAPHKSPFVGVS